MKLLKKPIFKITSNGKDSHLKEEEQNEQDKLNSIVHKHFPSLFLPLIENPANRKKELSQQKQLVEDTFSSLVDSYYNQTTPHGQKNTTYLETGIYLIYQQLWPDLSIIMPDRKKGITSFQSNSNKELNRSIKNTVPSNIKDGITLSDMTNHFLPNEENEDNFTDKVNTDISAMTIVLKHFNSTIYFDETDPGNEHLLKLKSDRTNNLSFYLGVKKYLDANDYLMTEEEYFQTCIELLKHLQNTTYPQCTHEIKEGSFTTRLQQAIDTYKSRCSTNSFAPNATDEEIEELHSLTASLKMRLDDKLQHEILRITFPQVLEHPLFTEKFKIKGKLIKDAKKPNGFCALYYVLTDANGQKIEVQLQSGMRYYESKAGISNHNDLPDKAVNVKQFFELVNPEQHEQDPEALKKYLSILGRTSKKQEKALQEKLNSYEKKLSYASNAKEKRDLNLAILRIQKKLNSIETARNSIKIKDAFEEDYDMLTIMKDENDYEIKNIGGKEIKVYNTTVSNYKDENDYELKEIDGKQIKVYNTKTHKRTEKYTIEQYLPIFAIAKSPVSMNIIGSAHSTFDTVAHVNKRNIVEEFTEILRKDDEVPYLADLLIDKLKDILGIKETPQISLVDVEKYALEQYYQNANTPDNKKSKEETELEI